MIVAPLTNLLKKDSFKWSKAADDTFRMLQQVLTHAPVLALPNFSKPFMLEIDMSETGIGSVLSQDNHPIAFFSKKMSSLMQKKLAYARDMHTITVAVAKFRHYLLGYHFIIQTNHKSLKECNLGSSKLWNSKHGYWNYWALISQSNIRRQWEPSGRWALSIIHGLFLTMV